MAGPELRVPVSIDRNDFMNGLKSVVADARAAFTSIGSEVTRSLGHIGHFFDEIIGGLFEVKNLLKEIIIGYLIEKFIEGFVQAGEQMERFQHQVEATFGQFTFMARDALQHVIEFARATPFATQEVIRSFTTLEAVGMDVTDKTMDTIASVAFLFNKSFEDVATTLIGMRSRALRQLGILMEEAGGKVIMKSGQMRIEVVHDMEEMRKAAIDLWAARFPDGLQRAKESFAATMQTMMNMIYEFRAKVGMEIDEKLDPIVKRFIARWNQFLQDGTIEKVGNAITGAVGAIMEELAKGVLAVVDWAAKNVGSIEKFGETIKGTWDGLKNIFQSVAGPIKIVLDLIKEGYKIWESLPETVRAIGLIGAIFLGPGTTAVIAAAVGLGKKLYDIVNETVSGGLGRLNTTFKNPGIQSFIDSKSKELGVDPSLVRAMIQQESSWDPNNFSKDKTTGAPIAHGLMMLKPDTYKQVMGNYPGAEIYDPQKNVEAGIRYIAYLQEKLGTKDIAQLAGHYFAGPAGDITTEAALKHIGKVTGYYSMYSAPGVLANLGLEKTVAPNVPRPEEIQAAIAGTHSGEGKPAFAPLGPGEDVASVAKNNPARMASILGMSLEDFKRMMREGEEETADFDKTLDFFANIIQKVSTKLTDNIEALKEQNMQQELTIATIGLEGPALESAKAAIEAKMKIEKEEYALTKTMTAAQKEWFQNNKFEIEGYREFTDQVNKAAQAKAREADARARYDIKKEIDNLRQENDLLRQQIVLDAAVVDVEQEVFIEFQKRMNEIRKSKGEAFELTDAESTALYNSIKENVLLKHYQDFANDLKGLFVNAFEQIGQEVGSTFTDAIQAAFSRDKDKWQKVKDGLVKLLTSGMGELAKAFGEAAFGALTQQLTGSPMTLKQGGTKIASSISEWVMEKFGIKPPQKAGEDSPQLTSQEDNTAAVDQLTDAVDELTPAVRDLINTLNGMSAQATGGSPSGIGGSTTGLTPPGDSGSGFSFSNALSMLKNGLMGTKPASANTPGVGTGGDLSYGPDLIDQFAGGAGPAAPDGMPIMAGSGVSAMDADMVGMSGSSGLLGMGGTGGMGAGLGMIGGLMGMFGSGMSMAKNGANASNGIGMGMSALTFAMSLMAFLEKGGVVNGEFLPLRAFSGGGVADRPTLGLIAERPGKHEAVIPLPDNRHVPVQFIGGHGDQQEPPHVEVHVQYNNPIDPAKLGMQEKDMTRIFIKHMNNDTQIRRSVQKESRRSG